MHLFSKPVQNEKKTQYSHFELQNNVKSVAIFWSLWSNSVDI